MGKTQKSAVFLQRPDLYGNTHRTGHDSQRARPKPAWDSFAVVLVETPVSSTLQ